MKSESYCPCCGEKMQITKYQEEIWGQKETVEVDAKCKCGYHYNKAYSDETVEYPDKEAEHMNDRTLQHPDISQALRTGYPQSPFSHLSDLPEIAHQCSSCGTTISEEQSTYGLCEVCEAKALERFKFFLCNEFTNAEREYRDACVEGNSLTEPESIKGIKAVYCERGD